MATKYITIQVDTDELRRDKELQTTLIRLGGRKALDDAFDEDTGFDFTEEEISKMSDAEFAEQHDEIMQAMSKGRIK